VGRPFLGRLTLNETCINGFKVSFTLLLYCLGTMTLFQG